MSLSVSGPMAFQSGNLGYLTATGDPSTTYTLTLGTGAGDLFYYGTLAVGTPEYPSLTLSGTPAALNATLATISIIHSGSPSSGNALTVTDGSGNTLYSTANCYLTGTRILTACGERPIDTLRAGDEVLTHDGGYRPVQWIGRQRFLTRFSQASRVQPVCIRAGALGDGTPHRNLHVSPEHSMLMDRNFVHAMLLVGCPGISQVTGMEVIEYLHLDLGAHHAILAEGAWSESYAEQWNRGSFTNAASWQGAPRFVPLSRRQMVEGDPMLRRIRFRLGGVVRQAA